MEAIHLKHDITLFCITADSFPDGVPHAWHQLHKMLDETTGRTFYGVSFRNEAGKIVYKAGVKEKTVGEAEQYGCETVRIPKGDYLIETIPDFSTQFHQISRTFQSLLAESSHVTDAVCVEWYPNERDVVCMVRQKEAGAVT